MKASPFCPANKIVVFGERQSGVNEFRYEAKDLPTCLAAARHEKVLLIGHNISFDLKYMAKLWDVTFWEVINNIYIWDTQQVAYLLSGQTHMYPSLNQLTEAVGGELKDDKIKEYWDNDIDTELIPREELLPYLAGDLENTEKVFRAQYDVVRDNTSLFNLIKVKMDDILCTTMMEINGMQFDLVKANEMAIHNDMTISLLTLLSMEIAKEHFMEGFEFNPMSNEHVSVAMFGGSYKMREAVPVTDEHGVPVKYKTGPRAGQVKTKMQDVVYTTSGMGLTPIGEETAKRGVYSVSDDVLSQYDIEFTKRISRLREKIKENETYYRGYSALVWGDGKIHPNINHCSTRTGRQSCTKPNLQNVTREE